MARVTVEDCVTKVTNRFDLVIYAARRANELRSGIKPEVEVDNDKETVLALREIADGVVPTDDLRRRAIKGLQKLTNFEEDDEEDEEEDETPTSEDAPT